MTKPDLPKSSSAVGRRAFLSSAGAGAAALAFPTVLVPRKTRAAQRLVARDPGGPWEKAMVEAFHKPFQQATGIEVVGVAGAHDPVAIVKGMVETKTYQWDVFILGNMTNEVLMSQGLLEPLNVDDDPAVQEIPAQFKTPTMVGSYNYAAVLAYRTDVYPAKGRPPTGGWKDLWDIRGIAGRRGLRKFPQETLEEALLADGVARDKVYPIDMDRAFKSLDKIKKDVAIWWTGGAQTSQLLKTGELDMCTCWNGRAQAVIDEGAPVAISWNQGLMSYDGWSIAKGSPTADLARKFIKFASQAQRQAAFTPFAAYGPTNPNAMKFVDPKRARMLPSFPEFAAQTIGTSPSYWGPTQAQALERFNAWMIS
ncbi:MAG: ABC transporter substrate-binding protein [Alphaproteobacteria bacterium]